MKEIRTIILAAGMGTRLKSDIPKVLHEICGQPLIQYVLDVARAVGSLKTTVVLGHQADFVKTFLPEKTDIVIQNKLLGTADAVKTAQASLHGYKGDVLILCGDTPLLRKESIKNLIRHHKKTKFHKRSKPLSAVAALVDPPAKPAATGIFFEIWIVAPC